MRAHVFVATPLPHDHRLSIPEVMSWVHLSQTRSASVSYMQSSGYQVDLARNRLVQTALEQGCSHIFFLDADITCPPGTLDKMLSWRYPAVTGVYERRVGGLAQGMWGPGEDDKVGFLPLRWPLPAGQQAMISATGAGCLLLETALFRRLSQPWFRYSEESSEDFYFCQKLGTELSMQILVDSSIQCTHEQAIHLPPGGIAPPAADHIPGSKMGLKELLELNKDLLPT